MGFQDFYKELTMHFCNHSTLIYSNRIFFELFINEDRKEQPLIFNAHIPPEDDFEMSDFSIKDLITIYANTFKIGYEDSVQNIWVYNVKSINARAINAYYEAIKKYLDQRGKKEIYEFHNYDWFRVLYILRQITSHGDNIFKNGVEFPDKSKNLKDHIKPYPNKITYQNISITRGQKTELIFNEIQLSRLLSDINYFFATNNDFNVGILNSQNFQKQKK